MTDPTDEPTDDPTRTSPSERDLRRMVLLRQRSGRRPLSAQAVLALAMRVAPVAPTPRSGSAS